MAKYDFTIEGNSLVMQRTPISNDMQEKAISFRSPSLVEANNRIKLFEAGNFQTSLIFTDFGLIDGEAPSDIIDAKDKLLTLFANFNGGGGSSQAIYSNQDLSKAGRNEDVLYGILDQYTGEEITLQKTTDTNDVDGVIYFQLGSEKFKRNFTFLRPEWFGLDGVNDEVAINKALAVNGNILPYIENGIQVVLEAKKTYYTSAPIRITRRNQLMGNFAKIESTSTTNIIEGITELLSVYYTHSEVVIQDLTVSSETALKGIDLTGFTNSRININVILLKCVEESEGISLNHGDDGNKQCYFNTLDNCKVFLDNEDRISLGTAISIKGTPGVSGANCNTINGGQITGYEKTGVSIGTGSVSNTINGLEFEHQEATDGKTATAISVIQGSSNLINTPHIENYLKGIEVTENSHSNTIISDSYANTDTERIDLGGNTWVSGNSVSVGGIPSANEDQDKIQAVAVHTPTMRFICLSEDAEARNYSFEGGYNGEKFSLMKSITKGGDPRSGNPMWSINENGEFELKSIDTTIDRVLEVFKNSAGTVIGRIVDRGTLTPSIGMFLPSTGDAFARFGIKDASFENFYFYFNGKGTLVWGDGGGTTDTFLERVSTGMLEINNGTSGTKRDLGVRKLTASDDIEITDSVKGIILPDTVLGTRHRIQLVSGVLTVSSAL